MAERKEKSNVRGDHVSKKSKESAKETPSKREASRLPAPVVETGASKVPKLGAESIHKGGSSTARGEFLLVDDIDGTRWTIQDKTVIDLLKRYNSAPDQKTKEGIVKLLKSYAASQESKRSSKADDLSKIADNIRKLKLNENPQDSTSGTKTQSSRSGKESSKKGATKR